MTTKRLRQAILISSILIFSALTIHLWDYEMDDAFITFKYAENLAEGHGLVFNIGSDPIEGYSNFLWLLALSLVFKLGGSTVLAAKFAGSLCFLLTGIFWYKYFERDATNMNWLCGPLFLVCPVTVLWGVSGLELGLHSLLIAGLYMFALSRSRWLYVLLPLLALSRPEAVAVAVVALGALAWRDYRTDVNSQKYFAISILVIAITIGTLTLFRLEIFGYPLPNTFYAKTSHYYPLGFLELGRMLVFFAPLTIGFVWFLASSIKGRQNESSSLVLAVIFLTQAVITASVDPVQNFLFRYMIPVLPILILAALSVLSKLRKPESHRIALSAISISLFLPYFQISTIISVNNRIVEAQEEIINWANSLESSHTIAMTDMGRIPYSTSHKFIDTWGLLNLELAHGKFDPERELRRFPDYFVLVGYIEFPNKLQLRFWREQQIAYSENFHSEYTMVETFGPAGGDPYSAGYYYLIFKRNS